MKKTMIALALLSIAGTTQATDSGVSPFNVPNCDKLTEGFNFVLDYSGSMNKTLREDREEQAKLDKKKAEKDNRPTTDKEQHEDDPLDDMPKVKLAKDVLRKLNERIPELEFQAALMSFAPFTQPIPPAKWDRLAMDKGIAAHKENMETFGRLTNMGVGISEYLAFVNDSLKDKEDKILPRTLLIHATDGVTRRGEPPFKPLERLYKEQPNVCLHIISFAELDEGKENIRKLQSLRNCTIVIDGKAALKDDKVLDDFIEKVFFKKCPDLISLRGINFAFDKYNIDERSEKILQEALTYINARDPREMIEINGWTDWTGSEAYNAKLSLNRAIAVRNWFVQHGVDAKRLIVKGRGKSYKYTNRTKEGRYLNRRMDLRFLNYNENQTQ